MVRVAAMEETASSAAVVGARRCTTPQPAPPPHTWKHTHNKNIANLVLRAHAHNQPLTSANLQTALHESEPQHTSPHVLSQHDKSSMYMFVPLKLSTADFVSRALS